MASNMMNLMKAKYAAMSDDERVMTAKQASDTIAIGFMSLIAEDIKYLAFAAVAAYSCLKLGFCTQKLSAKQNAFLKALFPNIESSREAAAAAAIEPISETDYKAIKIGKMIGREVFQAMFDMIMCAAYADKGLDTDVEAKIDPLFGSLFLVLFAESGMESVPVPKQRVTGLEARILDRMFKMRDDGETLPTFKTIKTAFPEESETSVQKALNNLCEKDLVHYLYGLHFKPYSVDIDRDDVVIDLTDAKPSQKKAPAKAPVKKANSESVVTQEQKAALEALAAQKRKEEEEAIIANRRAELARRRKAKKKELLKSCKMLQDVINDAEREKVVAEKTLKRAREALAALGAFQFKEKKAAKAAVAEAEDAIARIDAAIAGRSAERQQILDTMDAVLDNYEETQVDAVEEAYPLPGEEKMTPTQRSNRRIKNAILESLIPGKKYKTSEVKELVPLLSDSNGTQRTAALCRQLCSEGKLETARENRVDYYWLPVKN